MKYKIVSELLSLISISVTQANVKIGDSNLSYRINRLLILSLGFYSLCFLSQRSCDANNEPLDHKTSKNLTQAEISSSRTAPPKFSPCTQAELTSVRIFQKKDEWGSGVIFQKVESVKKINVYYVLTNEHVVRGYKKINVATSDGSLHAGVVDSRINFGQKDLAVVEFSSSNNYNTATIEADESINVNVNEGDRLFATGFPPDNQNKLDPKFQCLDGEATFVMPSDRVFEGGYQIGYDSNVVKGMSGGGVFDQWGNLVALNGRPKKIFFGNPYIFEHSGRIPCRQISDLALTMSWGIPISMVLKETNTVLQNIVLSPKQNIRLLDNSYANTQITTPNKQQAQAQSIKDLKNCQIPIQK
jgi:hypothetical protein